MELTVVVVVAASIFVWGLVSARLQRADLTAPIVFTLIGAVVALAGIASPEASERLKPLVEITLVWVLFADAARIRIQDLRRGLGLYVRLLAVGLPLTIVAGWGLAAWFYPGLGVWLALLVGAALAPTDAALGIPVVTNPAVPARIRRLITVESGLNDGISTPVVMLAIAGAAAAAGHEGATGVGGALLELAVGVAVGVGIGASGGALLRIARRDKWAAEDFTGIAVLALAVLAYGASIVAHGNGFVAAFCGGLAFGAAAGPRGPAEVQFLEQASGLMSLLVWLAFGVIALPIMVERINPAMIVYAVLSLTAIRMVPVALALIGAGLDRNTILFVGWFGPRGLASLVFALLALEELGSAADEAVAVIAVTVLLSVIAHGLSATPLASKYGRSTTTQKHPDAAPHPGIALRGLPRQRRDATEPDQLH
jgi:NhaP-type Na+/H+ or K+/H+ antiporter